MDPKELEAVLEALAAGDVEAATQMLKDLVAKAEPVEESAQDESAMSASATAEAGDKPSEELSAVLTKLGKATIGEALLELDALMSERASKAAALDKIELSQRQAAVAKLVALKAETPATAYSDVEAKVLCARLASEPIKDLTARVTALSKTAVAPKAPPVASESGDRALNAKELAYCKANGLSAEQFIALSKNAVRKAN